jgi:hypothetical protein
MNVGAVEIPLGRNAGLRLDDIPQNDLGARWLASALRRDDWPIMFRLFLEEWARQQMPDLYLEYAIEQAGAS